MTLDLTHKEALALYVKLSLGRDFADSGSNALDGLHAKLEQVLLGELSVADSQRFERWSADVNARLDATSKHVKGKKKNV